MSVGLVLREEDEATGDVIGEATENGWYGLWTGPYSMKNQQHGFLGTAVIWPDAAGTLETKNLNNHLLGSSTAFLDRPIVYYAGSGWQKSGLFASEQEWFAYVAEQADQLNAPLTIAYRDGD